jgi:hypothetical protein
MTPLNANPDYIARITPEKLAVLNKLDAWDLSLLKNKLGQNPLFTGRDIDSYILAYKRYQSFKVLRPNVRSGMISDHIDAVWHQHILYTENYLSFCDSIFGHFIHHVPCDIMDTSEAALREYGEWLPDYLAIYGDFPDDLRQELGDALISPLGVQCTDHVHADPDKYKCR